MTELGVLTQERVRLATGTVISDELAEQLASILVRTAADFELAMDVVIGAVQAFEVGKPARLDALRRFAEETPTA